MSSINVIGLAIGLMCSIFLLLYVSDELSYDRFHEKSHRLFRVVTDITSENGKVNRSAYSFAALAPVMRERMADVEAFTRVRVNASSFVRIGEKLFVDERSLAADSSFFDLFTYSFLQGDPETALVRPYTVVLSHSTARRYFGNKNPVGLTINVENSYDLEITAVVEDPPTNTHLRFDFLSSLETYNAQRPGRLDSNWRLLYDYTYVLLAGPHSAEAVETGLPALTNAHLLPLVEQWGNRFRFTLQPLTSIHLGSHREHEIEPGGRYASVYFSAAMAILVLLIACINFVNLSTAQATSRTREAGVRKAIGATRGQLTRQFLTESLVTATIATLLAVILFVPLLPVFNQLSGKAFSPGNLGSIRVAVSFLVVTLVAGIGGGIYPAFVLSASRPASALRGGPLTGLSRTRVRKTLVAMEFAFAVALMIIALIVYQQLTFMQRAKLGFDRTQVVVLQNDFPSRAAREMETIKNELLRDPAVQNVTLASEWPTRQSDGQLPFRVEGMPFGEGHQMAWYQSDEGYLDVLEMELVSGRNFMPEMASDTAAFLINETAVRQFGLDPGEAVGKRIYVPDGTKPVGFIIGVIRDFQTTSMHEPVRPVLIANYWARPRYILAKIDGKDVSGALNHIEATWAKRMPDTPISIGFLDQQYDALYRSEENLSRVVNTFAALAIFIACLGLVGLSALIARQRTKEVGIRKVLGASVSSIVALLSKDLVQLVAIAFLIAAPIAFLVMQKWLETFANRIDVGAGIFLAAGGLVLSISIVTVGSQAMRAALADPVKSLRYE